MACENCVNRRAFLSASVAAAAVAALAACGDGQIGPPATTISGAGVTVKLSDFPDLATVGQPVAVGSNRAVVRTSASAFLGLSMICTHEGCETGVQGKTFLCPCHGSQ